MEHQRKCGRKVMQRFAKPSSRSARDCGFESLHFRCGGSSTGRAPGCDPGGCGFKSRPSPQHCQAPVAQRTEHRPPAAKAGGSSPPGGTQPHAHVAQLERAAVYETAGCWFESSRGHHASSVPVAQAGRGGRLKPGVGAGSTPAGDTGPRSSTGQSAGLLHRTVWVRLPPRAPTSCAGSTAGKCSTLIR